MHVCHIARNPVEPVAPFRDDRQKEDLVWEPSEAKRFLDVARTHRLFAAFYLAMATGMRHGEILGLRWQDVETDAINICQSLVDLRGRFILSAPKTRKGIRRVAIDPETKAVLDAHKRLHEVERHEAGEAWQPQAPEFADLVFTTRTGGALHPRNFDRVWYELMRRAEVRKIRFHDLRHLHVSMLVRAGLDLRAIADRIGHTDGSFTMRRYAKVLESQRRASAIPLLQLLEPRPPEPN